MMARAYEDFGFETENVPLMIEAVPLSSESIMIVVTKVEDPAQIEEKLDAIGERPTHRSSKEPEEDRMADLALMEREEAPAKEKESSKKVKSLTYLFADFDTVCMAAHRLQPIFIGDSSLYKYNDNYFLVLNKNKKAHKKGEGVVGILDEFALRCMPTDLNELFLKEQDRKSVV